MKFVFIVHSVAVKLNYSTCKRDVSRAVGIPTSGDSGHEGTESPLHEIWWGFRAVGIPGTYSSILYFHRKPHILAFMRVIFRLFLQSRHPEVTF